MYMTGSRMGSCATAFAFGALAGTVAALLMAPRNGRETRERLGYWARDARDKMSRLPNATKRAVERGRQAGVEAFNEAYDPTRRTT